MLAFIHLSDIHFTKYSGDQYDIDQDLRDELLRDISVFFKRCIHRFVSCCQMSFGIILGINVND